MSQNVTKIRQKARLEYIEANILFKKQEEIAEELGVNRRTIIRDIEKWRGKGGFKKFLIKEFFELYGIEKRENPSRALDRVLTLLLKEETKQSPETGALSIKTQIEQIIKFSRDENADPPTPTQTELGGNP